MVELLTLVESKRKPMIRVLLDPRLEGSRRLRFTVLLEKHRVQARLVDSLQALHS